MKLRYTLSFAFVAVIGLLLGGRLTSISQAEESTNHFLPTNIRHKLDIPLQEQLASETEKTAVSVIIQTTSNLDNVTTLVTQAGGTITKELPIINGLAATLSAKSILTLANNPAIKHISLDSIVQTAQATNVMGEVGSVTGLTHTVQTVTLQHTYNQPVVIAQSPTINGTDPAVVRITNVTNNSFSLKIQEPNNGNHGTGETVSYLVVEAGRWQLADGTILEADTFSTNQVVHKNNKNNFVDVALNANFAATPVVLSQVQSNNGTGFVSATRPLPASKQRWKRQKGMIIHTVAKPSAG